MARVRHLRTLSACVSLGMLLPAMAHAETPDDLAPYKMLRSLQFVQDSVVLGDHSAAEMQRFMLGKIDQRFRAADSSVFDDERNVDAALIYTMSGGNPATLEYLVSRDVGGNFDNRVSDALRKYLSGKGTLVAKTLAEMVPEYRDKKIGAYLALVSANTILPTNPQEALKFYDAARLAAPGTIIEEAALRRSVSITASSGEVGKGLDYANRYARRFLHSPYASQFADLFVTFAVNHFGEITEENINTILDFMDRDRQREIYLRIARKATIAGKNDLARLAAAKAQALPGAPADAPGTLANLYGGVADIATADVSTAANDINGIPDTALGPRDKALRAAARAMAEAVLTKPDPAILNASLSSTPEGQDPTAAGEGMPAHAAAPAEKIVEVPGDAQSAASGDASFETFVTAGRSKLDAIDDLLSKESSKP